MDICVERIVGLLEERGLKNTDLTEHLGLKPTAVSEWKSGKMSSYQKYIVDISDFFDVSADYILGRTPLRNGVVWDDLVKQYQLCDPDKQALVDRLLGITHSTEDGSVRSVKLADEEDMTMVLELLSMFDKLNLVGKSRVIAAAADELDKKKTTSK